MYHFRLQRTDRLLSIPDVPVHNAQLASGRHDHGSPPTGRCGCSASGTTTRISRLCWSSRICPERPLATPPDVS
jgi:hypothetical protein